MAVKYIGDSISVDVTVYDRATGAPKALTLATVTGSIESPNGTKTAVTALVTDAGNGVMQITVPKDTTNIAGPWVIAGRVVIGDEQQVVYQQRFPVAESAFAV